MTKSKQQWLINPEAGLVSKCASVGRFLEADYSLAIKFAQIPEEFEENLESTGRKFVIIGARSVPTATAKSVFLCLRLSGADKIVIKTATADEGLLVDNVLKNWTPKGVETEIFSVGSDKLRDYPEWIQHIEEATDIVVFGGEQTAASFEEFERGDRRIYIHGPKFSFSMIHTRDMTMGKLIDICTDFGTYYGEGCLSPKFCIFVGPQDFKWAKEASNIMQVQYEEAIEEFRQKLPMAKKSNLVQQLVTSHMMGKYVRFEEMYSDKLFTPLYGDVRFTGVQDLKDLWPFFDQWKNRISTVACNDEDEETIGLLQRFDIIRACNFGEMQYPQFQEQFDTVDDFDIYNK